jgi:hypothetical protein
VEFGLKIEVHAWKEYKHYCMETSATCIVFLAVLSIDRAVLARRLSWWFQELSEQLYWQQAAYRSGRVWWDSQPANRPTSPGGCFPEAVGTLLNEDRMDSVEG